jgi:hypothetical protein
VDDSTAGEALARSDHPSSASAADDGHELVSFALELSLRQLDYDRELIDELRSRTGVLLAAASLAASFFGPPALGGEGITVLAALGLVAFTVALVLCIAVLAPRRHLNLAPPGYMNLEALWHLRGEPTEWRRYFVYWVGEWSSGNRRVTTKLQRLYAAAAGLLALEVLAFALAILVR